MSAEYIKGHRAKKVINDYSDWFIPKSVIDEVLKSFIVDKETSINNCAICYLSSANINKNKNK